MYSGHSLHWDSFKRLVNVLNRVDLSENINHQDSVLLSVIKTTMLHPFVPI